MTASGKTWVNGSPPTCAAEDLNGFEQENSILIDSAGIIGDPDDHDQTSQAVLNYVLGGNFYTDNGTANTYVLNPIIMPGGSGSAVKPPTVYFTGMLIRFKAANANSGASTVNVASLGAVAIVDASGNPIIVGDILQNYFITLQYTGTNFVLLDNGQVAQQAWSTGDTKGTYKVSADPGWLMMNDGTIGSATSGATYANANAQNLFLFLWTNCTTLNVYNSSGLIVSRGVSAVADWAANNRIDLPKVVGRTTAGSGTAADQRIYTTNFGGAPTVLTLGSTAGLQSGMQVQFSSTGTLSSPLVAATNYRITVINSTQISISEATGARTPITPEENYSAGTFVTLTGNGSGTQTMAVQYDAKVLGSFDGYKEQVQTAAQLARHTHSVTKFGAQSGASDDSLGEGTGSIEIPFEGTSAAMPILQPTTYKNWMIKL